MARFLNITPTYNPFTMDEMLKIPLLYDAAYKEADKNITDYKDKISYYKALAGDDERAKSLFSNYDSLLNNLANDYSIKNMQNVGKQLRDSYRDITAKFDKAEKDYNIYREMKLKNPNLVGDIGNIMDYYDKSYNPKLIDGAEFAKRLGVDIANLAQLQPYKELGYVDKSRSKVIIGQGFTNDQLAQGYIDALNDNPNTDLGKIIKKRLSDYGYNDLSGNDKQAFNAYINDALAAGAMKTSVMANPNYMNPLQALQYNQAKDSMNEQKLNLKTWGSKTMPKNVYPFYDKDGNILYKEKSTKDQWIVYKRDAKGNKQMVSEFTDANGDSFKSIKGNTGVFMLPYDPNIEKSDKDVLVSTINTALKSTLPTEKVIGKELKENTTTSKNLKDSEVGAIINSLLRGDSYIVNPESIDEDYINTINDNFPTSHNRNNYIIVAKKDKKGNIRMEDTFNVIYDPTGKIRNSIIKYLHPQSNVNNLTQVYNANTKPYSISIADTNSSQAITDSSSSNDDYFDTAEYVSNVII